MHQLDRDPTPWWRYPIMWLVVGGPLVAVVAATASAVIAVRGADQVLPTDDARQVRSAAPALQARNHAATPVPAERP